MKKIMFIILSLNLLFVNAVLGGVVPNKKRIFISQTVAHPALDATTKGVIDELARNGFKDGVNIQLLVESAQGNAAIAQQIANKFVSESPDLIVSVATLSAQSFVKYAKEGRAKMIFTTVTDPIGANIVTSLVQPAGNNISGVSNFVPLEPQLELFKKLLPGMKKIGVLYNPGELNSVSIVNQLKKLCPKMGLELVLQTATKSAEVPQSAIKLASNCDAIFISNDNTALSAMSIIIKAATNVKIPVFCSDTDAVKNGVVAALGPNQYELGRQTGKMIVRILNGEDIAEQPVEFPKKTELYLNLTAAAKAGIVVPDVIIKEASKVVK